MRRKKNGNGQASRQNAIHAHRQSLPIWAARSQLLEIVQQSAVTIVVGEPGSGKTTQIPQFLYSANMAPVACTQPRRVAAITIAHRVALETNLKLGKEVGYSVRFDEKACNQTMIKYLTDGMLVQEALKDPDLTRYKVIVVDEAHERSLQTDILMGLLKNIQRRRGDNLRLLIMSATLDAKKFSTFFEGARSVYIQGRQHPVEVFYTPEPESSYLDAALHVTVQVHVDEGPGDILVFLTGQEEIECMAALLREAASQIAGNNGLMDLTVCTIYAALSPEDQMQVFSPAPQGVRKVILGTNIAETSLTIPGVKFVIDPGLVKSRGFNAKTGIDSLQVIPVSQAQARQRSGRAGREGPGKSFRLYTESTFNDLAAETQPEIVRTDLSSVVLKLRTIGVDNLLSFQFVDPPPRGALLRSLELLFSLGALDSNDNLTKLGAQLSQLPLDPMFGRVLVAAADMGCLVEALAVLAMVSAENVYIEPRDRQQEAHRKRVEFISDYGDHLTLLSIFEKYQQLTQKERRQWCREHFLNSRSMTKALQIHAQLTASCNHMSLPIQSCGDDHTQVRRALVCGLFQHAARRQPDKTYKVMRSAQVVAIHPSSSLHSRKPELILFSTIVKTAKVYAREVTTIEEAWLPELVPALFSVKQAPGMF